MKRALRRAAAILLAFVLTFAGLPMMMGGADSYAASSAKPSKVKSLSAAADGTDTVVLKWSKASKNAEGYAVYRDGKLIKRVGKSKRSFTDTGLSAGTAYKYNVKACNTYRLKKWYNKKTGKWQTKKPAAKYCGKSKTVKKYRYGKSSPKKTAITDPDPEELSGSYGDFSYSVKEDGTVMLTAYNGTEKKPEIPSQMGARSVTEIGKECFRGNIAVTKLTIPEGITAIDDYAFECCSSLKSVTFPETLETIGRGAFSGCSLMTGSSDTTTLTIPAGVSSIGDGAFLYCMAVKKLVVKGSISRLGQFAFAGCVKLKKANFKSRLSEMPDRLFCNCTDLTTVTFADGKSGPESIGKRAFSRCESLKSISFTDDLEYVGDYAFEECHELESVDFGNGELSVGRQVLYTDASDITWGTSKQVSVNFSSNTVLDAEALYNANLKSVSFHGSEDGNYKIIDGSLYTADGNTLIKYCGASAAKGETVTFTIPEGVSGIAGEAFSCNYPDYVSLPASIAHIDDQAFFRASIKGVTLDPECSAYTLEDGVLYENEGGRLVRFFTEKYAISEEGSGSWVPTTAKETREVTETVDGKETTKEVTFKVFMIPDRVTELAPYSFYGTGERIIQIGAGTALTEIGDYVFKESGLVAPGSSEEEYAGSYGYGKLEIDSSAESRITISEKAFEDSTEYMDLEPDDDEETLSSLGAHGSSEIPGSAESLAGKYPGDGEFSLIDDNSSSESVSAMSTDEDNADPILEYSSAAGEKSLYSDEKYASYTPVQNSEFTKWTAAYVAENSKIVKINDKLLPYCFLYKGETHYRTMACVLNHDIYKEAYSVKNVGDDYKDMYLMMDHGLFAELARSRVPYYPAADTKAGTEAGSGDIVLYSGVTVARVAELVGASDKTKVPDMDTIVNAIDEDKEYTMIDSAMMSLTTNPTIAYGFSDYSKCMFVIYASKEKLDELGAVCIDAFNSSPFEECEVLVSAGAKFKLLDAGTLTIDGDEETRTYVRLELVGVDKSKQDTDSLM